MRVSVRVKLLGGFASVVGLLVVVGVVGVALLGSVNGSAKTIGNRVVPSLAEVGALGTNMNAYRKNQLLHLASPGLSDKQHTEGDLADERGAIASATAAPTRTPTRMRMIANKRPVA